MSWYEVVEGESLLQGDLIPECPIPSIPGLHDAVASGLDQGDALSVDVTLIDVCVLTQSCDIDNQHVDEIVLAQVVSWQKAVELEEARGNTFTRSEKFRKIVVDGNAPSITLLHKHDAEPQLEWSIVDFHRLFVLQKAVVESAANAAGKRLRLIPPYREHLGQAFARYFMRVGLPHDAKAFEKQGYPAKA